MAGTAPRRRRGRILVSLLALLFVVGVVPLLFTSWNLVAKSRESLELDQKALQLDKARSLSQQVAIYAESLHAAGARHRAHPGGGRGADAVRGSG